MAIRASSSKQIDALIADLSGPDEVAREAAIARLTVIGDRAVDRLVALADAESAASVRTAALRALEGIGSERAIPVALRRLDDAEAATVRAAIGVAKLFLKSVRGPVVIDRLTSLAVDAQRPEAIRVAAVSALRELEPKTIRPLLKKLAADPSIALQSAAQAQAPPSTPPDESADRGSHDAPEGVREWLAREGLKAPLSSLLGIVDRVRQREASEPPSRRDAWIAARFAAHLILARRRSRIALYDLRESLEAAKGPLPADAIAAVMLIGDASCVEPLATAYAQSKNAEWRRQLLEAFHTVVKREKLTPRHAVMKRVEKKIGKPQ